MSPLPLSLYIHIPWCVRKCPYCDFNSHEAAGEIPEAAYIERLRADLQTDIAHYDIARPIHSIFIGGGTPSLFSAHGMTQLMAMVRRLVDLEPDAEVTLEANPGTLEDSAERFAAYHQAGINRLSLGAQSFNDDRLEALGRIHTAGQIGEALRGARDAGIERINIDIMHGLPGQSATGAIDDLAQAVDLGPEHISWYQLTIEPNTTFYRRPPVLPDEDILAGIFDRGLDFLDEQGYDRYEISAFAGPGEQSRHNLNYWGFGDYLGIGAGAHGKVTHAGGIERTRRTRLPRDYLAAPTVHRMPIQSNELLLEFLMNALRLPDGFTLEQFTARTRLDASALDSFLERACHRGLVEQRAERIHPTPLGLDYLNDLLLLADDSILARG